VFRYAGDGSSLNEPSKSLQDSVQRLGVASRGAVVAVVGTLIAAASVLYASRLHGGVLHHDLEAFVDNPASHQEAVAWRHFPR